MEKSKETTDSLPRIEYDALSRTLIELGFLPSKKGFYYLRYAVAQFRNMNKGITTVYKETGTYFNASSGSVERCIRVSIAEAARNGALGRINQIFDCEVFTSGRVPTNGEIISVIAEYLTQVCQNK